ncbi:2-amino-4-hydroxy-6-hydroxymethyldihydropteridine diphosphokinase [Neptuniibacter marinus]|uniref:2-amino-4-hydroxy-6- hydroxymethyldihydropteridine diphosphokinase n=1 Tax=Neptuniibacter marinus TaxID=1806670 RepID=UPI0008325131|nr:2-amino-4-hydroxy-6-hydroxymethyldihydropteridine diphosphokinase [Neptuniibacter marinus]
MAQVFVSVGSNTDRERYTRSALDALQQHFGSLLISSVYESEAVGFEGDNFLNLVAEFKTELSVSELSKRLKRIEDDNGRCRKGPKFSGRTLDIDILTYDQYVGVFSGVQLPRDEVTKNAFVLQPLAEIAPDIKHPELDMTYAELWGSSQNQQKLWTVEFEWAGHQLPCRT